jgi:hypothetical protein
MDFFCLAGGGIRAGYPSAKLLRALRPRERRQFRGRVVLALTSDRYYALQGVRRGAKLSTMQRRLRVQSHFTIGRNTWYVVRGGRGAAGILKVRHRRVEEIGIAPDTLTRGRARARRFMASFD